MAARIEEMTVEQFLSQKAGTVEDAIVSHCKDMCSLIMSQYEEARNGELGEFEQSVPGKTEMGVTVTCSKGPHQGQVFLLKPKSKLYPIIGRSSRDDVVKSGISLLKDHEVSSYHGKLFIRGGQLKYKDTNSLNHSYINGEMVEEDVTLKTGDILRVGQSDLLIEIKK